MVAGLGRRDAAGRPGGGQRGHARATGGQRPYSFLAALSEQRRPRRWPGQLTPGCGRNVTETGARPMGGVGSSRRFPGGNGNCAAADACAARTT